MKLREINGKNKNTKIISHAEKKEANRSVSQFAFQNKFFFSRNSNELCAFWASIGECESNRLFMMSHCAAACRFCLLVATHLS
jgi:hypothetical protein